MFAVRRLSQFVLGHGHDGVNGGTDAAFADQLRGEWQRLEGGRQTATGGVNNQVTGTVNGKVLQAGDIHGDISF